MLYKDRAGPHMEEVGALGQTSASKICALCETCIKHWPILTYIHKLSYVMFSASIAYIMKKTTFPAEPIIFWNNTVYS